MNPETNNRNESTQPESAAVTSPTPERLTTSRRKVGTERFVSPAKAPKMTQQEWREFIQSVAGSIPDPSFFRHDQGTFEQRDEL